MITKFKSKREINRILKRHKENKLKPFQELEARIYLSWQKKGLDYFDKEKTYTNIDVFNFMRGAFYEVMEEMSREKIPDSSKADGHLFDYLFPKWQPSFEKLFEFEKQKVSEFDLRKRYDDHDYNDSKNMYIGKPSLYRNIHVASETSVVK